MPQLIEHIDAIDRKKQRDVLIVEFHSFQEGDRAHYRFNLARELIIDWLDTNDIAYEECAAYANDQYMDVYRGQIYVDVPNDENDAVYSKLEAFLENPDGTMKFDTAWFCGYRLEYCMKNAHHDVTGFWDYLNETM
jgi:hypothetical protein